MTDQYKEIKDPDNPPIFWDKAKADLRIQGLEEENKQKQALINDCFVKSREQRKRIEKLEEENEELRKIANMNEEEYADYWTEQQREG
jgi:hypothetical protein